MNKKIIKYLMIFLVLFLSGCGRTAAVIEEGTSDEQMTQHTELSADGESIDRQSSAIQSDNDQNTDGQNVDGQNADGQNADGQNNDEQSSETVNVYVCGAVRKEGVYSISSDGIVDDALKLAGGYREDAYHGYVNLAAPVRDGMRIYFPTQAEMETVRSDDDLSEDIYGEPNGSTGIYGDQGNGSSGENTSGDSPSGNGSSDKSRININTAGKDELTSLPGIGESRAEDIIKYREEHGKFKSIDEIKNINGIKEGIFEKIRDLITI